MKYYNRYNYTIYSLANAKAKYKRRYQKTGKSFTDVYREVPNDTIVTLYVVHNQKPEVRLMKNGFKKCSEEPLIQLLFDNIAVIQLYYKSMRSDTEVYFKNEKSNIIEGAFAIIGVKDDHVVSLTKEQIDKFLKMTILVPQCIGF